MHAESLQQALEDQDAVWHERPLLRELYREWHRLVASCLADVEGASLELGAGTARFSEVAPFVVPTDVEATRWAQEVVDAEALPYEDSSVANLVLIDVFHHLARPARFLDESRRVLVPGGRVVILDPYCSPLSTFAYKRFHHERTDPSARAFEDDLGLAGSPLTSNQARATLVFFREANTLRERWPELRIAERRRLSFFLYPLSGGYSRRPLVPGRLYRPLAALERALRPLAPLAAFRCLVVLELVP